MIHAGFSASALTMAVKSSLSGSRQPGCQNNRSRETKGTASLSARARAKVVFPAPEHPMTRTRCTRRSASTRPLLSTRRLEPCKILAGMVRRARQRRCRDHEKSLGIGHRLQRLEFVGRQETLDLRVLARRLQILADGKK